MESDGASNLVGSVIVAQRCRDVFSEALVAVIRRIPDLHLVEPAPANPTELDALLSSHASSASLLVLLDAPAELGPSLKALADRAPTLAMLGVAVVEGGAVRLEMPHLGLDDLVELLRRLASGAGRGMPVRRVVALDAPPVSRPAAAPPPLAWLDAVLRLHLARNVAGEAVLPGLTLSAAAAERLLDQAQAGVDAYTAGARAEAAAAAALTLERTLSAPPNGDNLTARLVRLVQKLELTLPEAQALLLCLAPELHPGYGRVLGLLHDDLGRRAATLGLIGAVLGDVPGIRAALAASGGLERWALLEPRPDAALSAEQPLRVDPAIASWLLDGRDPVLEDPRLSTWVRQTPWPGAALVCDLPETDRLADALVSPLGEGAWLLLSGDATDWPAVAEAAAARRPVLRVAPRLASGEADPAEAAVRIARGARLTGALPLMAEPPGTDEAPAAALLEHLATLRPPVALVAASPPPALLATLLARRTGLPASVLERAPAGPQAQARMLHVAARQSGLPVDPAEADAIAALYPLPAGAIEAAAALAAIGGETRGAGSPLARACRQIAMPHLPRLARRIEPAFQLKDVVLPQDRAEQLAAVVTQARHSATVLDTWGFGAQLPYGRGIVALFTGPSGTGKTMAAQAIACALGLDLFQVDLARVVSKYIGDTEKHLDQVFAEAELARVVLLFDEADALFARRAEVKDAHDRYANIETAYLLQRLEAFPGLAILTTNLRQNIDTAFLRRLRAVVEFPRPDATARERIWRQCLPEQATAPDLDLAFLARRLEVSGGTIRQMTLAAAFAAAAEGGARVEMRHLIEAARLEMTKLGLPGADLLRAPARGVRAGQ